MLQEASWRSTRERRGVESAQRIMSPVARRTTRCRAFHQVKQGCELTFGFICHHRSPLATVQIHSLQQGAHDTPGNPMAAEYSLLFRTAALRIFLPLVLRGF